MKRINDTLIIGLLLIIVLALAYFYPQMFAAKDPFSVDIGGYRQTSSGKYTFEYLLMTKIIRSVQIYLAGIYTARVYTVHI
ncbi:hypothetical protein THYS13_24620 [Thermoanaerobacter sp. YS13]|uniref:hypothetical protein n=1 Tax=Thermoanaerobacter sp. YS13 TaxID=1511746 RepID=UPI000575C391|nr:hypothetical protein [Thermoanaerobacter sp. YS13]KHO60903.1 hypothetical protein THYS13_24620 [Thermoanaerobacter sp. YS13]